MTISNITAGRILTRPSNPGWGSYQFVGWYKESFCVNLWNFDSDTVAANTTLYAKWVASTYSVSGKVVDDQASPAPIDGASVKVMQGNIEFGSVTTDSNGNFSVGGISNGIYNLVVTKGEQKITECITVNGSNVIYNENIIFPSGSKNAKLDVIGADTPNVVVDHLNAIFTPADNEAIASGSAVEIKLTVQKNENSASKVTVEAAMSSGGYSKGTILDVDIIKTITYSNGAAAESVVTAINTPIKLIIPLPTELQGKTDYVLYRAHDYGSGVVADAITTTANGNGESIQISSDKTYMTAYLKYFSTYAIAYTSSNNSDSGSSSHSKSGSASSTSKPEVITNTGLPYYVDDKGNKIFIGFAKDVNGKVKYIAPTGKTVLFADNDKSFTDISSHWAKGDINFVTERELFLGTSNKVFSPDKGMTRAMFATVLGRLYERSYGAVAVTSRSSFSDVESTSYYSGYVEWAAENNIISGLGNGKYEPNRQITREEMAAMLYRFAGFMDSSSKSSGLQLSYMDSAAISKWAADAAAYCEQTGIITGREGRKFAPKGTATRAEVAAILERFIENTIK
ncbi:S-layer homology domain-containing protein [Aminipila terrae]|uniref:SLH domain-containing protein n=1 Tax=Aminipila terrae TaxID=2697030 RepID=A0A6P1ME12_9FIRM|nr:S-layer homology domain-containing protein [Aminipila terrae]QHI72929.1 hypothetical protein Ami3637_11405 [Aminipila terrae]